MPLRSPLMPWLPLLLAPAWLACGAEASLPVENLGSTSDLRAEPVQQSETVTAATGKARLNGHWTGLTKQPYIEVAGEPANYHFPSGSRSITLDLSYEEDSFISGSVVFGAGSPPPPEAGVAYPPGIEYGLGFGEDVPPVEGFSYALSGLTGYVTPPGAAEGAQLSYQQSAPFSGWCPLQPGLPTGSGAFNCIGGAGTGGELTDEGYVCERHLEDGTTEPVDCNMAALCSNPNPCVCTAAGCTQGNRAGRLLVELDGDELMLGFLGVPLGPVTLSRAANP